MRLWQTSLAALAALAPLLPAALVLYNTRTWHRPQARARNPNAPAARVSVLIPARDEARNIEAAVRSVLAQDDELLELLVYSDASSDGTDELVSRLAEEDSRVRLLRGRELPEGWVGKPHACQRLFEAARGDVLLFMDADVRLEPHGLSGLLACLAGTGGVVTAVPRQLAGSFLERLLLPLLHLTYTAWLPLRRAERWSHPACVAANGQLLLLERTTLRRLGGFAAVRSELVDDVQFCRHAKRRGFRVCFVDAHELARCRMYRGARELWAGFSKNLFEGLGSEAALALALLLHAACFLLPYCAFALLAADAAATGYALGSCALGVLQNLALRALLAARHGQPWTGVLLHPLGVIMLMALALDSWRRARFSQLSWAGRRYHGRASLRLAGRAGQAAHGAPPGSRRGS
jgi:chlorobactene glucosyltransferase